MKKTLFSLMTIALMAVVCVGLSACSSDDEGDGGGNGSGSASGAIPISVKAGYFIKNSSGTTWELYFFSKVPDKDGWFEGVADAMTIDLRTETGYSSIPEGEFQNCFAVDIIKGTSTGGKGINYESGRRSETTGKLVITKNGSGYKVSLSGVAIYEIDDNDNKVRVVEPNFTFNYSGAIVEYPWKDYDK